MPDPANISVSQTLRSGRDVEIRSQRPQDRKDLEAALARMSDESLHRRFFSAKRHFSEKEAERFLDIDFVNHVALVARFVAAALGRKSTDKGPIPRRLQFNALQNQIRWLSGIPADATRVETTDNARLA